MTKIAFLMDPLSSLNTKKDSTLAMIDAAQKRELEVFYLEQRDIFLSGDKTMGAFRALKVDSQVLKKGYATNPENSWYNLGNRIFMELAEMNIVMLRKDPPFNMNYIYTTYLLERAEASGALVVNRPASVRDCNEKLFATSFPQCCPPLIVSSEKSHLLDFYKAEGSVVFKKLDGMGGDSVFRVTENDPNANVIIETLTQKGAEPIMAQKFLPEIVDGDKRILMLDGQPIPYALARIPSEGEARGNLAAGGTAEARPLTQRDKWISQQVGPELKRRGLTFVGIDVIGDYLTEINVTCPTCIRELDEQEGLNISDDVIEACVSQLK
tara:strand:- start:258 stop:1232 length:975 start_codon:yes stop_codon:yes gene_type:complete